MHPVDWPDTLAPPKPKTRFYVSAQVDPQRAKQDLSLIANEIIVSLALLPVADVTITVEIEGLHGDGFEYATMRTISEISRMLNFKTHGAT